MPKYGKLENGELFTSDTLLEGYKPIKYAEIPEFDQMTQAVYQGDIVDKGDHIEIGVQIRDVENLDDENEDWID